MDIQPALQVKFQGTIFGQSNVPRLEYPAYDSANYVATCLKDFLPGLSDITDIDYCLDPCDGMDNDADGLIDENPFMVGELLTRACYSGPESTLGIGRCNAGLQSCIAGVWTTDCVGEIVPQSEDCSNLGTDDDCDTNENDFEDDEKLSCDPCYGMDDHDPCTVDTCDADNQIITHEPVTIDDGNDCTIDQCQEGEIIHTSIESAVDNKCGVCGDGVLNANEKCEVGIIANDGYACVQCDWLPIIKEEITSKDVIIVEITSAPAQETIPESVPEVLPEVEETIAESVPPAASDIAESESEVIVFEQETHTEIMSEIIVKPVDPTVPEIQEEETFVEAMETIQEVQVESDSEFISIIEETEPSHNSGSTTQTTEVIAQESQPETFGVVTTDDNEQEEVPAPSAEPVAESNIEEEPTENRVEIGSTCGSEVKADDIALTLELINRLKQGEEIFIDDYRLSYLNDKVYLDCSSANVGFKATGAGCSLSSGDRHSVLAPILFYSLAILSLRALKHSTNH